MLLLVLAVIPVLGVQARWQLLSDGTIHYTPPPSSMPLNPQQQT